MSAIDDCQNTPATEHETDLRLDLIARIASGEVGLEDLEMVLERSTPPSTPPSIDPEGLEVPPPTDSGDVEPAASARGRGAPPKKARAVDARAARRIRGRTIYLPDDLFERILVQAHRRDRTISEYVTSVLDRQVSDYRTARAEPVSDPAEAGAA
jgi:hypothetical protein